MEPLESITCDQCGDLVVLQNQAFFEGPGSSWWCTCPGCQVVLDPDQAGANRSGNQTQQQPGYISCQVCTSLRERETPKSETPSS